MYMGAAGALKDVLMGIPKRDELDIILIVIHAAGQRKEASEGSCVMSQLWQKIAITHQHIFINKSMSTGLF